MSELPVGWVETKFGELVQLQKGRKPTGLGPRSDSRTIAYINIAAFETQVIAEYAPAQNVPVCEPDDTLLVWDGARAGLAGRGASGFIGSTLSRLRSGAVIPGYLYYFISSQFGVLNSQTKGVGIPHVDPVVLAALKFQLPPLAEQTRIVQKLEELLTGLDAGVAELKAAQKKLALYRQSLLKAAVDGSLTAEWRDHNTPTETGAQLLTRILQERRARWEVKQHAKFKDQGKAPPKDWQKKYPEPVQPDTSDLPELPTGWVWATIDQTAEILLGKMLDKSKHIAGEKKTYLRNTNVRWGAIETDDLSEMFFHNEELYRYGLAVGDVLVCEGGEPGRAAVCLNIHTHLKYQKALHRVRFFGFYEPNLLVAYLEHLAKSRRLDKSFTGSTINHFTKENFLALHVPLPPKVEQNAIVSSSEEVLANIGIWCSTIEFSLKQAAAQRQNILRAAFSGQLVPQDASDEPASVLLARIRAERADGSVVKKLRGPKAREAA